MIDDKVIEFGTDKQKEYARAANEHGSQRAAAKALGIHESTIRASLTALKKKAAKAGVSHAGDVSAHVPPHHFEKQRSSFVKGEDGVNRWIKTDSRKEAWAEAFEKFVDERVSMVEGLKQSRSLLPSSLLDMRRDSLCPVFPLGDPHFGMLAGAEESGEEFNLEICKDVIERSLLNLVARAPAASQCVIGNLGDTSHSDTSKNATPKSGNPLDADHYYRVIAALCESHEVMIDACLTKYDTVYVYIVKGNHDPTAAAWLSKYLDALYRREPRVVVCTSPAFRLYHRFGVNLLGFAHGDKGNARLPLLMATERAKDWADTTERLWLLGHVHHASLKDFIGVQVRSFRTTAARDAYHASEGYLSRRDMRCIVFHRERGIIEEYRIGAETL